MSLKKPDLQPNSMMAYLQNIKSIYNELYPEDNKVIDLAKLLSTPTCIIQNKIVSKPKLSTQNVFNSAFYAFTGDSLFKDRIKEIKDLISNETQNNTKATTYNIENQITPDNLTDVLETTKVSADNIYRLVTHFNMKHIPMNELQTIQKYVMLSLMSGKYIPPRRSKDYYDFKIKNVDNDKDNYLDHDTCELVFNSYKTKKSHGTYRIKIPVVLFDILNKWIDINPYDYLLINNNGLQMSPQIYGSKLNAIFGSRGGKSTNQLRHSFLQNTFPNAENMNKILSDMGTSSSVINYYVKDFKTVL